MVAHAIEVADLQKVYRQGLLGRSRFTALKGVTLHVESGEIFGLLGPNGAGKTTFIKILLGIVSASQGRASLLGYPAGDRQGRQRVGYLPENLRIPPHHHALSALDFYGRLSRMSGAEIAARRTELLQLVGLAERARDPVRKYSKGMLQRLGLAQALMHDPDVLILDEPTDGLDPLGRKQVRTILSELKRSGKTIFLNSHLLQEVELICDRVAILDRGELRGVGSPADLAQGPQEGIELELTLLGPDEAVRGALEPCRLVGSPPVAAGEHGPWEVVVQVADQPAIDRCVDQLRARGVSILRLAPRRVTLEDTFLNVLGNRPAEPS